MTRIIIQVEGGVIQDIIATEPCEVLVVDWDNIKAGESHPLNENGLGNQNVENVSQETFVATLREITNQIEEVLPIATDETRSNGPKRT